MGSFDAARHLQILLCPGLNLFAWKRSTNFLERGGFLRELQAGYWTVSGSPSTGSIFELALWAGYLSSQGCFSAAS